MTDVYELIGRSIRKASDIDNDIGKISDETILPAGFTEVIEVHINAAKTVKNIVDLKESFILGMPLNSIYGVTLLQTNYNITGSDLLHEVYNSESTYYETLADLDIFSQDNSSATILLNDKITFNDGQYLTSNPIFFSTTKICDAVKVNMVTTDYDLNESSFYFRNSQAGSWVEYTEDFGDYMYFDSLGSSLEYKIIAGSDNQYLNLDVNKTLFKINYLTENESYIFLEEFYSTMFYNNTLGSYHVWDIYNNRLDFGGGGDGEVFTNKINLDNESYNYATLELGSYVGSLSFFLSTDDKVSWVNLKENIKTAIPYNNNIFLQIIGSDYSYITNDYIEDTTLTSSFTESGLIFPIVFLGGQRYEYVKPAIKLTLQKN